MMQTKNPYLPSWEYVPDGEPHVFGNRVYVYGSHDRFRGYAYCLNDYVCWSAPADDLGNWQYEGVIYKRTDDPANPEGEMCLYAPDVACGADGRYYLYYVLDQLDIVSVAVCDTPAGKYEFLSYVCYEDGTPLGKKEGDEPQFDPGVLVESENVYLYTGFCGKKDPSRTGAMATVLKMDMVTVKNGPAIIVPGKFYSNGSGYEGHEFFEASSVRKVGEKYYFIYSSVLSCELCYVVSEKPTEGFVYGGTIVSNNDIGISKNKCEEMPLYYGGNNHGSIIEINENWYVFYHRHTDGTNYSRQGCIEKIQILQDGSIPQVEMTSMGAGGIPFEGEGEFPAYIACNLFCNIQAAYTAGPGRGWMSADFPKITQEVCDGQDNAGYIENMRDSATAGFKYFNCQGVYKIMIRTRGRGHGVMEVLADWDGSVIGCITVLPSNE